MPTRNSLDRRQTVGKSTRASVRARPQLPKRLPRTYSRNALECKLQLTYAQLCGLGSLLVAVLVGG